MRTRSCRNNAGFTLLEIMAALCLFGIAALGMAHVFASNISLNTRSERTTEAIEAGQQYLDELRVSDPSTFPTGGGTTTKTIPIGGKNYDVTATYCADATYCTSNNLRYIEIEVKHNNQTYYEVDTIFTQLR